MWELPLLKNKDKDKDKNRDTNKDGYVAASSADSHSPLLTLRHSITDTDYLVRILAVSAPCPAGNGRWLPLSRLASLPLTGLCRKVLQALQIQPFSS